MRPILRMALIDLLLPEYDREVNATRAMLDRVPATALDWRPHPRSMTLGRLANHLAELPRWMTVILSRATFDLRDDTPEPPDHATTPEAIATRFTANGDTARAALAGLVDGVLEAPWTLARGGQPVFTMPRIGVVRHLVLNHLIHHRGQLTVYLRLLDVPVAQTFGPTADFPDM